MEPRDALRQRWQSVQGRRDALEAEAEARVRRWVWTTGNSVRWRFQPFYGERAGESPGRILTGPPERLSGVDAYGYDADGRLALARLYRGAAGEDDAVIVEDAWTTFFDARGGCIRVGLVERDDAGRVTAVTEFSEQWGEATCVEERFVWQDGRLTEIHKRYDEEGAPEVSEVRFVEYDEHGDLEGIRLGTEYEYRRPDVPVGKALKRFEQALPTAIGLALARADQPPFALALQYHAEYPIPPTLVAGSREDWEASRNPAEWAGPELPLPLGALGIEGGVLAGAVGRAEAEEEARATLERVAERLSREPPEGLAEDGVVIAVCEASMP